ncbi:hypothetical protein RJT34_26015 [Clitoria ternatea]|uniref:Uncharacterized protein n=1 Tax=Clitoria ternatea TaxID=43366 RepID=A0AAN9IAA0_CLITE
MLERIILKISAVRITASVVRKKEKLFYVLTFEAVKCMTAKGTVTNKSFKQQIEPFNNPNPNPIPTLFSSSSAQVKFFTFRSSHFGDFHSLLKTLTIL